MTRGKHKKVADARRAREAAERAAAQRVQQAEYTARLEEAEARRAEAAAALAQLLPGLLEGMAAQAEMVQTRKELIEVRAENKRRWSSLRAVHMAFNSDLKEFGDPKRKISDSEPLLTEAFMDALIAIRDEGGVPGNDEEGRDHPNTILRKRQAALEGKGG